MQTMTKAANAYQAAATHRTQREQEADVFRRANGALRSARDAGPIARVRALADNRRLWLTVADLMGDPQNALPLELRASVLSVGMTVQREMDHDRPDFDFLIEINQNIAEGLSMLPEADTTRARKHA
jgi:flagellar biosynthesis activator protein FlaF